MERGRPGVDVRILRVKLAVQGLLHSQSPGRCARRKWVQVWHSLVGPNWELWGRQCTMGQVCAGCGIPLKASGAPSRVTDNQKHPHAFPDAFRGASPARWEPQADLSLCPWRELKNKSGNLDAFLYWRFSRLELIGRLSHVKLLKHNNMDSVGSWLF